MVIYLFRKRLLPVVLSKGVGLYMPRENKIRGLIAVFFFMIMLCCLPAATAEVATAPESPLLATAYAGGEKFRYSVSWLGIPAGELVMEVERMGADPDRFALRVTARTAGLLDVFYPVEDRFLTIVEGRQRLPVRHEMQQREGRRRNEKLTLYNQETYTVSYQKNDGIPEVYALSGTMHNEFSSFFFLRVLSFAGDQKVVVPTFADKKRHEVVVSLEGEEERDTLFGRKKTLKVQPQLNFKGLYEKVGHPLIWLTDDSFRVPVRIEAKIIIGSLAAHLVEYHDAKRNVSIIDTPKVSPGQPPANSE